MNIKDFISNYKNHPVLFVGTGVSLRYLKNSYTWDGILSKISLDFMNSTEYYLDIKSQCQVKGKFDFPKIASNIEIDFNQALINDRNGKFKEINDIFYKNMALGINISRFKIYISQLLSGTDLKEEMSDELAGLKKVRKNIGSIITTNYDTLIETIFDFDPLIGNNILLSNPYGSVYKIHGCISDSIRIIISENDYAQFDEKYELIRAQLLSIFIHNPIIFLGYNIGDENIKKILRTIFTYIEPNSSEAERIRENFLLVEYEKDCDSQETSAHDIELEGFSTIRINKIKTDNYSGIYEALSELMLPISAMDIRKVQSIVKEIYAGGNINVKITEDLDSLNNGDKILAIGSSKTITYQYITCAETISNYFTIIDESNSQALTLINKYKIQISQYFPIFGFSTIYDGIVGLEKFKKQQLKKLEYASTMVPCSCKTTHGTISSIMTDGSITDGNKETAVFWSLRNDQISLDDCEAYLRIHPVKNNTSYKKLLCAFDHKKFGEH